MGMRMEYGSCLFSMSKRVRAQEPGWLHSGSKGTEMPKRTQSGRITRTEHAAPESGGVQSPPRKPALLNASAEWGPQTEKVKNRSCAS